MKRILNILLMMVCCLAVSAQTTADKYYNEGCAAMRTMTIASQNTAISKFQQAKKLYDSAANKTKCDQQIQTCNSNISFIRNGGGNTGSSRSNNKKSEPQVVAPQYSLVISNDKFDLGYESKTVTVKVEANMADWKVEAIPTIEGASFVSVSNKLPNSFDINCQTNPFTVTRTQIVEVSLGDVKREIYITQSARPVNIFTNENLLEFKRKGGNKTIEVYCNYDLTYKENNDKNWIIVSKPEWVTLTEDQPKQKGGLLGKISDATTTIIQGDKELPQLDANTKVSYLKVIVTTEVPKGQSRQGEIVLQAGEKTYTIVVVQK